jgi:hypothetical protein
VLWVILTFWKIIKIHALHYYEIYRAYRGSLGVTLGFKCGLHWLSFICQNGSNLITNVWSHLLINWVKNTWNSNFELVEVLRHCVCVCVCVCVCARMYAIVNFWCRFRQLTLKAILRSLRLWEWNFKCASNTHNYSVLQETVPQTRQEEMPKGHTTMIVVAQLQGHPTYLYHEGGCTKSSKSLCVTAFRSFLRCWWEYFGWRDN